MIILGISAQNAHFHLVVSTKHGVHPANWMLQILLEPCALSQYYQVLHTQILLVRHRGKVKSV